MSAASTTRAATRIAVALALPVVGIAACGDDDEGAAEEATTAPVDVRMTDFAYDVSGALQPGGTLRIRNDGDETHMMAMGRLHDGVTLDDLLDAFQSDDGSAADALVDEVGAPGNILTPGHELELTVPDLGEGTYAMLCFFGVEGDGTPHVFNGMAATLTVEGEPATSADADAAYRVTTGEAIDGPAELDAGHHVLEITATGAATDLEASLWRVDDGQTLADVRDRVNQLADAEVPAAGSGLEVAEHLVGIVNPFGESGRLLVGVDLEAGSYILAAIDTDESGEPEGGTREQLLITVG